MKAMISAFRPEYSLSENVTRTNFLKAQLTKLGLSFEIALGCYESSGELSASVEVSPRDVESLITLGHFLEQDTILVDTGENDVFLFDCTTKAATSIGDYQIEVNKEKALTESNYSIIDGRYYIVA